jgi:hypothetical protein
MLRPTHRFALLALAALFAATAGAPALADSKKFLDSDDAKKHQDTDPQTYLKDYDKLVKGKEAQWVYFPAVGEPKTFKTVTLKPWTTTGGKPSKAKAAAEAGPGYFEGWIKKDAKLGWQVVPSGGDLTIEGNICNAWEPDGGARFWGGWMANPGSIIELVGKDKNGNTVFEIRHKARGSTVEDSVENGLEKILKTLQAWQ